MNLCKYIYNFQISLCTFCSTITYGDNVPEMLSTSEKQIHLHLTQKRRNMLKKEQEAVGSNKIALPYGEYNSKIIGSMNCRGKETLGCQERVFTNFVKN